MVNGREQKIEWCEYSDGGGRGDEGMMKGVSDEGMDKKTSDFMKRKFMIRTKKSLKFI